MSDLPPFWQPARARAQLWRTALGFTLVMASWLAGTWAILYGAAWGLGRSLPSLVSGSDFEAAAAFFLTFLSFHIALALVLPLLHRRRYRSLWGPALRPNLRHFTLGALATLGIAAALGMVMWVEPLFLPPAILPSTSQAQPLAPWLLHLTPALALILLQTLGEEAVFRGYLLQQLAARFRSPLIWALLPALVFGLLHLDPGTYGWTNAALYVLNAATSGTLAALITARTGNLAAAAGLHFGNNASLTLLGIAGSVDGFSLFTVRMDLAGPYTAWSLALQTAAMLLAYALWRRAIAKAAPAD